MTLHDTVTSSMPAASRIGIAPHRSGKTLAMVFIDAAMRHILTRCARIVGHQSFNGTSRQCHDLAQNP
jgi:hypothetical protein